MYALSSSTSTRRGPRVIPGQSPYVRALQTTPQHPSPYVFSAAQRAAWAKLASAPAGGSARPSTAGLPAHHREYQEEQGQKKKIASGDFASWRDYHRAMLHLNELGGVSRLTHPPTSDPSFGIDASEA
eukprot:Hpha_TRINITY_DN20956_c0_g1::TRINITY_DN20956_c0_g1_i1::g.139733::m.139733